MRISDWSSDVCSSDLSGRDSKLSSLMPRREEMEKRLLRTGKGWTVTQYMLASMGVFVIFTGALLVLRTPFLLATLVGLFAMIGLPYLVVGRLIKRRVGTLQHPFPEAIELIVSG